MKGKITWLNWSLKKKIRKNGERYIVIQGRVEEIDFTSQVPAQVWKVILGSKWRKSVDHKPASREHSGDWSDLGVTLHHDTPTSFIKSLSTWCLAGVDFLSLWKSPQQHFSEPRLLRSVIALTGMATEVEMGSYAEKKSWKKKSQNVEGSHSFTSPWPWGIEPDLPNLQGPRRLEYMRFNFESEE